MDFYSMVVSEETFLDHMDGQRELEGLPDYQYEGVVRAIMERAAEPSVAYGMRCTDCSAWFINTKFWDRLWDAMGEAVDEYIALTAREVLAKGEYELAHCDLEA